MEGLVAYGLVCFVSLLAVVEPLGLVPMFIGLTRGMSIKQQRHTAKRACLAAAVVLVVFAVTGQFVFRFFEISLGSLKIVGGILFFRMGFEMLHANHHSDTSSAGDGKQAGDLAITPIGIPMIAGPGAIANVTVRWAETGGPDQKIVVIACVVMVLAITLLALLCARRVSGALGESGSKAVLRIMGLITMMIAVEFFFSGITPFVQRMFPSH